MMPDFENCTGYLVTESHQWFPVAYTGSIEESLGANTAEFVTALGRRHVFDRGVSPREWRVSGSVPLAWARSLKVLGGLPAQPFYWLSPLGVHTNILPSSKAINGTPIGVLEIGGEPVEMTFSSTSHVSALTPVRPGMRIRGSAYASAGRVQIEFFDSGGKYMSGVGHANATAPTSRVITPYVTVPEGAYQARVAVVDTATAGGLALWLEEHSVPTGGSSSCAWVTLHDVSVGHESLAYENSPVSVSYTLKEVAR